MKIVQSYWSKPTHKTKGINTYDRNAGGWIERKYNLMSWALSCLQFREFYDEVQLVTDEAGKSLLIDELALPYTDVQLELDSLNDYNEDLWILGKLHTYAIQKEPFIHADGDIFIWDKLGVEIESSPLISQHLEHNYPYYKDIIEEIEDNFDYIPQSIIDQRASSKSINACNAGILGGHSLDFFKKYTDEAFKFINNNKDNVDKEKIGYYNIIFEQYLFYCMAHEQDVEICYLAGDVGPRFEALVQFNGVPNRTRYVHPLGFYKKMPSICDQIANRLRKDHPDYYYRITHLLQENRI